MIQLSLFSTDPPEAQSPPVDLDYIRKSLNYHLRMVRAAQILPWSVPEAESLEKFFPQLAAYLPAEEASALVQEFNSELGRLRGAS